MNLKRLFIVSCVTLSLSACGNETEKASPEEQAKVDSAITAIKDEKRVKDILYEDLGGFQQWNIGVIPDGDSEYGYASYICEVLHEHGLNTGDQVVRIVDITKIADEGFTPKRASLKRIECGTYTEWPE